MPGRSRAVDAAVVAAVATVAWVAVTIGPAAADDVGVPGVPPASADPSATPAPEAPPAAAPPEAVPSAPPPPEAPAATPPPPPAAPTRAANLRTVIGTSVRGREIVARHYGAIDAPVQLVVLGQMHGTEPAGRRVVVELAHRVMPDGVGMWLITSLNPDGAARGTRTNARGVDLNRNFPTQWRVLPRSSDRWAGRAAASEPETRAMMAFLDEVRPTALLSFHQALDVVDISHPRSRAAGRQLAALMGERAAKVDCHGRCTGTMTQWVNSSMPTIPITVELDAHVSAAEVRRTARSVIGLGSWLSH